MNKGRGGGDFDDNIDKLSSSSSSSERLFGSRMKQITSKIDTGRNKRVTTGFLPSISSTSSLPRNARGLGGGVLPPPSASTLRTISSGTSSLPRAGNNNRLPLQPSKDPSVRAFVKANARVTNVSSLFHDEIDTQNLSAALVRNARKSGVLNLSGRNLTNVPMKVWRINELDENERTTVSVSLDDNSEDKWWEFLNLSKLIIANNYVKDVPCDISNLQSLQTFDAHDNQIVTVSKDLGTLSDLSKLDLSHNKLSMLPEEIGNLKRLGELKLGHNLLDEIPQAFGNLSCLRIMDVSNNNLTEFPKELGFLSFLQSLNLSNNKLTELPEEIGGLTGLRTFDASENRLATCPNSFKALIHLEIVYLQRNKLKTVPDVSNAKNLKELYLQNNSIKEVNSEMFASTKVNLLDFRMNKLETLTLDPEELEFLERFYLENNEIAQLPNELALLPSLKALTLEGNPIRGIRMDILQRGTQEVLKYLRGKLRLSASPREMSPGVLSSMPATTLPNGGGNNGQDQGSHLLNIEPLRLGKAKSPSRKNGGASVEELGIDPYKCKASRSLLLASRQIATLEPNVFQLAADSGVNCIDLSKNIMMYLPPTIDICHEWLQELKLDFNRLTDVPSSLGKCSRLQFLTLQNNQLSALPETFSHLKCLREINLGYNRFGSVPSCLYEISTLEIINLASNRINKLDPDKLQKLGRLGVFDVTNNNIAIMPPELGLMTQLKSLSIEGNAFRVPNYQVISQGTDTILNYLRNRIKNE